MPSILATFADACLASGWALVLVVGIGTFIASWRRGKRIELWSDEESRMRAATEAGASPAVADQLARKNKIGAIKWYRMETGVGLKEAKDAVERYERALCRYEPWASPWQALRGMP